MDSLQQQLEDLMSLNADTELRFDDGILHVNSAVLSFFSSVLRAAIEAHSAGVTKSSSNSSTIVIPMQGLTKKQWLAVAPFWHPVEPTAAVKSWDEAELLLRIGSRFNLRPVFNQAVEFLAANVDKLTAANKPTDAAPATAAGSSSDTSASTVWKWLLLADELHLTSCLPALITRAVWIDRSGCGNVTNIQGLSAGTLYQLVAKLAVIPLGLQVKRKCGSGGGNAGCVCFVYAVDTEQTLCWKCNVCASTSTS